MEGGRNHSPSLFIASARVCTFGPEIDDKKLLFRPSATKTRHFPPVRKKLQRRKSINSSLKTVIARCALAEKNYGDGDGDGDDDHDDTDDPPYLSKAIKNSAPEKLWNPTKQDELAHKCSPLQKKTLCANVRRNNSLLQVDFYIIFPSVSPSSSKNLGTDANGYLTTFISSQRILPAEWKLAFPAPCRCRCVSPGEPSNSQIRLD